MKGKSKNFFARIYFGSVILLGMLEFNDCARAEEDPSWLVNPLTSKFFSAEYS